LKTKIFMISGRVNSSKKPVSLFDVIIEELMTNSMQEIPLRLVDSVRSFVKSKIIIKISKADDENAKQMLRELYFELFRESLSETAN